MSRYSPADKLIIKEFGRSLIIIAFLGLIAIGSWYFSSHPQHLQVLGISTSR